MSVETVRKACVVGNSGAGKTLLARRLAVALGVPHVELDGYMHLPGWRASEADDFRRDVHAALAAAECSSGGWVVDGNYLHRLGSSVTDRADVIVWLDYARPVVFGRVLRRTTGRVLLRRKLWNGNRERLSAVFSRDPLTSILRWSWTQHPVVRERYEELSVGDPRWLRLRQPRDARRFLRDVSSVAAHAEPLHD